MSADPAAHLTIENRLGELGRVEEWLAAFLDQWAIPSAPGFAIDLVINEAVTNIISYAYRDTAAHAIDISLTVTTESVVIQIEDDGEPFNPFDAPPSCPPRTWSTLPSGGAAST